MRSTFESQLTPCFGKGPRALPPPQPKGPPSPITPRTTETKPTIDRMVEARTHVDFLKALITCDNSDESHRLQHNLAKAEQDGRCIRRARSLLGALFVFACAGMLAGDIVLPNMFDDPRHHFVRALCILGLASLISQLACFGYLLQHRALVRRLHKQCQRLVLDLVKAQLQMSLARLSDAANQGQTRSTAPSPAPFQFEAASPGGRKSGAA